MQFFRAIPAAVLTASLIAQAQFVELPRKVWSAPQATFGLAIVALDCDGDGDLDLVVSTDDQNLLFLGDGKGNFTDVTSRSLPASTAYGAAVVAFDADNDGDQDLLFGNNGPNEFYLNDGNGVFSVAAAAPATHWYPQCAGSTIRA